MDSDITAKLRENFADKEYAHAYVEDFLNASIATQIKVLREERELTQIQLAERAEMRQSRISVMEDVNYGSWNIKTLLRLAAAFDVALVVTFESFSKMIAQASSFSRSTLSRPSRLQDLSQNAVLPSLHVEVVAPQPNTALSATSATSATYVESGVLPDSAMSYAAPLTPHAGILSEWVPRTSSKASSALGAYQ